MKAAFGLLLVLSVGSTTGCTGAKKEEHDSSDPAPSSQLAQVAEDSWFLDITDQSGIDFVHVNGAKGQKYLPEIMGAGGAVLDFDRDGFMDIFLVQSGHIAGQNQAPSQLPDRLFRNRGNGTFEDLTQEAGIGPGITGWEPLRETSTGTATETADSISSSPTSTTKRMLFIWGMKGSSGIRQERPAFMPGRSGRLDSVSIWSIWTMIRT